MKNDIRHTHRVSLYLSQHFAVLVITTLTILSSLSNMTVYVISSSWITKSQTLYSDSTNPSSHFHTHTRTRIRTLPAIQLILKKKKKTLERRKTKRRKPQKYSARRFLNFTKLKEIHVSRIKQMKKKLSTGPAFVSFTVKILHFSTKMDHNIAPKLIQDLKHIEF